MGWFQRLSSGLGKTRHVVQQSLDRFLGRTPDQELLEDLESSLLTADLGARVVDRLMRKVNEESRGAEAQTTEGLQGVLSRELYGILKPVADVTLDRLITEGSTPFVFLVVGVNGVGKTTTIAKIAQLMVAGDTFRAAAIEQLQVWGDRIGVEVVRQRHGADPAAVAFDGIVAARARKVDVVLIDTAGRLHTKSNLMDELRKVKRVIGQELPGAPHEVLLVLDATLGQNALAQARQFHEAVGVSGLVLTKLDGTARGGIVVAIAEELKIPIRLIGIGEGVEDLQDFNAEAFVAALFGRIETHT
jgi:fused signal recognition particle receptor